MACCHSCAHGGPCESACPAQARADDPRYTAMLHVLAYAQPRADDPRYAAMLRVLRIMDAQRAREQAALDAIVSEAYARMRRGN